MALITKQPTSFTHPDPSYGGSVTVAGQSNTGHGTTSVAAGSPNPASANASMRWTGFQNVSGQILQKTLKVNYSAAAGGGVGPGIAREFTLEYSLNGGANWSIAFQDLDFTGSIVNALFSLNLANNQDLTQVQVRDNAAASVGNPAEELADISFSVANIRIEVVTSEAQLVVVL